MSFYDVTNQPNYSLFRSNLNSTSLQDNIPPYSMVPIGNVSAFAGSNAPAGYFICDGSAVSRTLYSNLFNVIGTTYGVGNGSSTFNIPNLKGRFPVGLDSVQTEFNLLAETGGYKTHTLTIAEMPSHLHTGTTDVSGSHNHTGTTDVSGSHTHTSNAVGGQGNYGLALADGTNTVTSTDASAGELNVWTVPGSLTINSNGNHTHDFTTTTIGNHQHTFTSTNTGGGQSHNNLQPYIVMNYIIKF